LVSLVGLGACAGDDVAPPQRAPIRPVVALATPPTPARAPQVARYYEGYLAEVLRGDVVTARAAYEEVVGNVQTHDGLLAARASLRLAAIEAWSGNRREAYELLARATALGGQDEDIVERADHLHDELATVVSTVANVPGPPIGSEMMGVTAETHEKFARAEKLALTYYRASARGRARKTAAEAAARAYGAVIDLGEPAATVAAEFRIGSLYHDLALAVVSEQPPELIELFDITVRRQSFAHFRRQQRAKSVRHLRTARAAYLRSLAIGETASSARWRREARKGLESVNVLLRGSG
jgi:tetratricopeptide (TPR) repeat protein